jgi:hypothetical protein
VETVKSVELRKSMDEQISLIKSYVDGFELSLPKDEAALGEICELLMAAAQHIREMDEARIKRKRLMGELSQAFLELEDSQKRFAKSAGVDGP